MYRTNLPTLPLFTIACLVATLAACSDAALSEPLGSAGEKIVGGAADPGHPAVVDLYIDLISQSTGGVTASLCTGTLISPRVILSAAHCTRVPGYSIFGARAYFGSSPSLPEFRPIFTWAANPAYDGSVTSSDDIAVFVLTTAVNDVAPIPRNRAPLAGGETVTSVGFGMERAGQGFAYYPKRSVTTSVASVSGDGFHFVYGRTGATTCQGDSGGPELITINGVETVAGVTSYGPAPCESGGATAVRVDAHAAFIDGMVATYSW